MYNLSFMFYFYLGLYGSKNDEKKEKKKRAQLGLYSHCSSSSQYQELMEKISPLPCNDVKVQLYESSIMYDSKYFKCGYEGQRKGEWVI